MDTCRWAIRIAFLSLLSLSVSLLPAAPKEKKSKTAAPAPAAAAATETGVDPKLFVIGAEDVLLIRVWREPELSGQVTVRPDGKITLQLLNEVQAAGLSPEKLAQNISEGLTAKYMNKAEVSVSVLHVNSRKYFIQGEVGRPGVYPLLVPTTILEALVHAGGFRDFANQKKITIMRKGERLHFNYKDVIKGKNASQNITLEPGDLIIVP
jgi:polysaccharide export outer membrane protein